MLKLIKINRLLLLTPLILFSCQEAQMGVAIVVAVPIILGFSFLVGAIILSVLFPSKEGENKKKTEQSPTYQVFMTIFVIIIGFIVLYAFSQAVGKCSSDEDETYYHSPSRGF